MTVLPKLTPDVFAMGSYSGHRWVTETSEVTINRGSTIPDRASYVTERECECLITH